MKVSFSSTVGASWGTRIAQALRGLHTAIRGHFGVAAAAALLLAAPMAQAQVQNGGFETGDFSSWTLRDYNRSNSTIPVTSSSQLGLTATGTVSNGGNGAGFRSAVLTTPGTAANTGGVVTYPFSGSASALIGGNGGLKGASIEQVATMALSDVDPVDGKVHIRFAMAPVLNNPGHPANQQPFFYVEVINQTKGNSTLFNTFNYSNQPGIPWQSVGSYQFTNWQGFDISPGNGLLDVGDQVLLKIYVSNCAQGAAAHTGQVYVDVFGSKMPGLSVYATGPAITKPSEQVTYTYNYINNSGVLAIDTWVRLAAPITEDGLHLTFVPGSYPASCTGVHAGTSPRADYIDCPVGNLNDGDGGNFQVSFTVPAGAATTSPNNVVNNGDYDIRANTVSPFIGPLVKTIILPSATPTVDLGITVSNGGVPSYAVGGAVTYTVTVTNNGPIDVTGASITQTLSGVSGTAAWVCAPAGGSSATCGAASGAGAIATTGNLPVGQSLIYTVTGIAATAAGTNVVTVVNVAPPVGTSDNVASNNTDGLSTPVSAEQHTLTVNTTGAGTGRVNAVPTSLACASPGGAPCNSQLLGKDQEAYLTAVADPGSIFKNWTGDCTTITGNQCYVKMGTVDLSVTAVFAKVWTVTPSIVGGTITPNTPQIVEDGQGASFTITPGTPGQVPVITTPGGANTCPGTLTGPVGGNYTYSVSPVTADCAFNVTFATPAPKLEITKSGPATAHQGIAYDYTLTVTNSGTAVTSAPATVTDTLAAALIVNSASSGCVIAAQLVTCTVPAGLSHVAPANTATFTINVTPNPAEVAGPVVNRASISGGGDPLCPAGTPCDSNPVTTTVQALSIDPVNDSAQTPYGTPVTTIVGANDTATNGTVGAITSKTDGSNGTVTCTGTGAAASCTYTPNTGFTGTDSYTYTICLEAPYASICKTATVDVVVGPNAVNDSTSTVQNTPVTDTVVTNDTYPAGSTFGAVTTPPGGSVVVNPDGSYTFTPDTGFTGTTTFDYQVCLPAPNGSVCDVATVTVTVAAPPSISVVKSVLAGGPYSVGNIINYSFLVTNTGGVQLTGVVVNDALLDAPAVCVATTLAPGASTTCTGGHTVTAAEVAAGYVHNSATASGTPPTIPGNPAPGPVTSTPSTTDTATTQNPAMTMVKSVTSTGPYAAGDVIAYAFLVTNTGNTNLSGIAITDALLDAPAVCPVTTLAPGANTTCTGNHTVTAADVAAGYVHNSATASGNPPTVPGNPPPAAITTPPSTVDTPTVQNPAMTLVKSVTSAGPYAAGNVIAYAFLVTNTGNTNLSGIAITDALLDAPAVCPVTTLAPGASTTCTGGHTVTAAEVAAGYVQNTATASGTPPTVPGNPPPAPITTPPSTVITPSAQNPQMTIVKSVTSTGPYVMGDVISYAFLVTNTGDVTLTSVAVNDALLNAPAVCPVTTLAPGASTTCTGSHTVTAAEVAVGYVHNSATATGTPPTVPGGPAPTPITTPPSSVDTATVQNPAMTVVKSVTSSGPYAAGDVIAYAFFVTNAGNVILSGIVVNDALLDAPATCPATTLAPGASTTCTGQHTVTAADVAVGFVHNSATATGNPPTVPGNPPPAPITTPPSSVDTATVQNPAMAVVKSVTSTGPYAAGDVIDYAFLVSNTGNVTLSGIVVNDVLLDAPAVCPVSTLAPGASTTCTGSHTVTAADVAAGYVHNSATATGTPPTVPGNPPSAPITTPPSTVDTPTAQNSAMTLVKSVTSSGPYAAGDVITYAFLVTNTGNVTLSGIVVNDALLDAAAVCPATTLAPGASTTCTGSHTVTAADVAAGYVHNSATASGTPPAVPGNPPPAPITTPPSTVDTATVQNSAMTMVKSVTSTGPYAAGDVIVYAFLVTNTGNTNLSGITITDALLDAPAVCPVATLVPGASTTCTGNYTVTAADVAAGYVHNSATASGTPPTVPGNPPPAPITTPPSTVDTATVQTPAMTVAKSVTSVGPYTAGSIITYAFLVTNTGNVTLSGIVVNDALLDASAVCPVTTLAPGASTTCTGSHTVTATDVEAGNVHNVATATGTPPTVPGGSTPDPVTSDPSEVDTAIAQHPSISAVKTATLTVDNATPGAANIGDVITYAIVVTNTGDVTLNNLSVADTMDGYPTTSLTCAPLSLAPGASAVCDSYTHTVTVADANRPSGNLNNRVDATAWTVAGGGSGGVSFSVAAMGNAVVLVEPDPVQIRLVKTATPSKVKVGDLVRYTLTLQNTGTTPLVNGRVMDTPPAGFTYVAGSLAVNDQDGVGQLLSTYPLSVSQVDVQAGQSATITYLLRVGAGVRAGVHTNSALINDDGGERVSNVATADVELTADALLDESLIVGTVFDDRDSDGWQDSAALSKVQVQGGFSPSAYVAGSTTVDRGQGAQPEADASAPMLHGIAVGALHGRDSDADLASNHRVVISQTLSALDFTDDFVLTSAEGVTLRMDADGKTTLSAEGKAAKGLTSAIPAVTRKISQVANGYQVDFIIENQGVDERGIPGVRIATVEGLLVETDQYGRYHLTGIDGGRWERGRNFIMKVDPATLPPGTSFTTENPKLRRVTPGLPVRFDFGVKLPNGVIEGGKHDVEMELGEVLFAPESAVLRDAYLPVIDKMAEQVRANGAGEVVISANGATQALAMDRAKAVREALVAKLDNDLAKATTVTLRADLADPSSTLVRLGESPVLGTILFDTDKSTIKPEFVAVIDKIAADIEALGGGVVGVTGHADRRGSDAYNLKLGLRRAKAVYEAIAAKLSPETKAKLRVEINDDPSASVGLKSR
ncbi:MAG: DUF11 domain-containing protein [Thermomonas sp.]|uniref:DUF7507 domain-containing protein n=1 Tax=Thermomonas sp. TaxID=1971895 RepID=UPI001EB7BF16|nr:Ig-like domain-containing protein [Thermomonas sp.]MBV2210005.1 DUF11 domain-containing protein [Thermomonas sp.]